MDGDSVIKCSNQRGRGTRESAIWIQKKNKHANGKPEPEVVYATCRTDRTCTGM